MTFAYSQQYGLARFLFIHFAIQARLTLFFSVSNRPTLLRFTAYLNKSANETLVAHCHGVSGVVFEVIQGKLNR
jgi:hypothetical protein